VTDVDRLTVSIRISGADLDPGALTHLLGVEPTFAARPGDRWSAGGREFTQRTGVWSLQFGGATGDWTLAAAIGELLGRLPADIKVWKRLASVYRLELFCGVHLASWESGLRLAPELLRQLADRSLELDFGLYSPVDSGDGGS
jgi:Domain of unknown function (DUF4279)